MSHLTDDELASASTFAWRVADAAENILSKHRRGMAFETKVDGTPVTEVDREVEEMVIEAVAAERPGDEVLGEEGMASRKPTGSLVWVVDPIDGTELFAAGKPGYVFSMALVVDGQPEVAVVRDPLSGQTWSATIDSGAWVSQLGTRPDFRLRVSDQNLLRGSTLRTPRRPENDGQHLWPEIVSTVKDAGVTTLNVGSVIRSCMMVAEGRIDGVIFGRSGPWDMASAALIVPEAGGRFTDLVGLTQRLDRPLNGAIVSNLWLHEDLVQTVMARAAPRRNP